MKTDNQAGSCLRLLRGLPSCHNQNETSLKEIDLVQRLNDMRFRRSAMETDFDKALS